MKTLLQSCIPPQSPPSLSKALAEAKKSDVDQAHSLTIRTSGRRRTMSTMAVASMVYQTGMTNKRTPRLSKTDVVKDSAKGVPTVDENLSQFHLMDISKNTFLDCLRIQRSKQRKSLMNLPTKKWRSNVDRFLQTHTEEALEGIKIKPSYASYVASSQTVQLIGPPDPRVCLHDQYGLRAKILFKPGDIIGFYTGQVACDTAEVNQLFNDIYASQPEYLFGVEIGQFKLLVDGAVHGNWVGYINAYTNFEADTPLIAGAPNVQAYTVLYHGFPLQMVIALTHIAPGTEFLLNYGQESYWQLQQPEL